MKYILRYTGKDKPDKATVESALSNSNIRIVEGSALPRFALVEMTAEMFRKLKETTGQVWAVDEFKQHYATVPTTRRKVRR